MSPEISLKRRISIIVILLLLVYVPSASALQANYTARENPTNVTATNGQVDYKTLAIMADMYLGLGKISIDLNQTNFTAADIDYQSLRALYENNKDVILHMYDTNAAALETINSTDLTMDDIRAYLTNASNYHKTYGIYKNYTDMGDVANATATGVKLRVDYGELSDAYNALQSSSYASMSRLDDSNQENVNSSLLQPFMDATDRLMLQITIQNRDVQVETSNYDLTLTTESTQARIGDTVQYIATLNRSDGSLVPGANVVLYVNGAQVSSATTGPTSECVLSYQVPNSNLQNYVKVYAEYIPTERPELPAISDTLFLHIIDEPTSLSLSLAPNTTAYGDVVNVAGRLVSDRGFPAIDSEIDVYINDAHLGHATTDNNGAYAFSFPITESTPGGDSNITARYDQATGNVFLDATSPASTLHVIPQRTFISLNSSGDNFTAGDLLSMSGKLVTENGLTVSGAKVLAYMDGGVIGDAVTDKRGYYSIQARIPYDSTQGSHSLTAVYAPGGGALERSSSSQLSIYVNSIKLVMDVNGTPLVLFANDMLNVTGALHTESGVPLGGQTIAIRVSDTIWGTVITDQHGDFRFSRSVNSSDSTGFYRIFVTSISPSGIASPASVGPVLIIPVDKTLASTVLIGILVLLALFILWVRAGMSFNNLKQLAIGRSKLETDGGKEAVYLPVAEDQHIPEPVVKPPIEIPGYIGALIGSGSFNEAALGIYAVARQMAASCGVTVRDSDTHREFYRMTIKSYPLLRDSLGPIVDTYERMQYGHMDAGTMDIQNAFKGLQALRVTFDSVREGKK